ncbi:MULTISPECIES: hypothetical protein [Mycolicibacterium]|uniref:hypothetical protein n=1 Tax=Mycolicibacterium TaxID=1866885 RepID=UPI0007EBBE90|nr:hypothetical protein [Mycolicibacterium fortuitum]OBG24077.1 hypothetical protein A5768_22145 [Mycolicibacterium fortuitum]
MANELHVDAAGLQAAAASSDAVATALTSADAGNPSSSQPSAAGVTAMNAALTSVRERQSSRITGQSADLSVSGVRYDSTDGDGRDGISGTVLV